MSNYNNLSIIQSDANKADDSLKSIMSSSDVHAINEINSKLISNTASISNTTLTDTTAHVNNNINNVNIKYDTIYKMDELQSMQTNELNDQLRELERIQNIISTKDRLINETTENTNTYHKGLHLLIGFIGLSVLLAIPWIAYLTNKISYSIFITVVVGFIIIYAVYVAWKFNFLYLHTIFNNNRYEKGLGRDLAAIEHSAYMTGQKLAKDARQDLYGNKSKWINNHCSCPEEETSEEYNTPDGHMDEEQMLKGYFYYDGTAPKQLLVPEPNKKNAGQYKDQIDWVDYSKSIQNKPGYQMRQDQEPGTDEDQPIDDLVGTQTWSANM